MNRLLLISVILYALNCSTVEHPLVSAYRLIEQNNYSAALQLLKSFTLTGESAGYQDYLFGLTYLGENQPDLALDYLIKSQQALPDKPEPRLALIRCYRLKKDYPAAYALLLQQKKQGPPNQEFLYEELQLFLDIKIISSALETAQKLYFMEAGSAYSRLIMDQILSANGMEPLFFNFYPHN